MPFIMLITRVGCLLACLILSLMPAAHPQVTADGFHTIAHPQVNDNVYQPILSANSLGGESWERAYRLVPDLSDPSVKYLAGAFQSSTLSFPAPSMAASLSAIDNAASNTTQNALLLKIRHEDNAVIWALPMGASSGGASRRNQALSVAVGLTGSAVFAVGDFSSTSFQLGAFLFSSTGPSDAWIAKLDASDGTVLWARTFEGTGLEAAKSVVVDPLSGDVIVAGDFNSSSAAFNPDVNDIGARVLNNSEDPKWGSGTGSDIWIAKLGAADGQVHWMGHVSGLRSEVMGFNTTTGQWPVAFDSPGQSLAVDEDNNVYMTGSTNSTVLTYNPGMDPPSSNTFWDGGISRTKSDGMILKIRCNTGLLTWGMTFGMRATNDFGYAVAVAPNNGSSDVFVAGTVGGSPVYFGDPVRSVSGIRAVQPFVARLSAQDGTPMWITSLGVAARTNRVLGLAVDTTRSLIHAAGFVASGNLPFGQSYGGLTNDSSTGDGFLWTLGTTEGHIEGGMVIAGMGQDVLHSVAVSPDVIHLCGFFNSPRVRLGNDSSLILTNVDSTGTTSDIWWGSLRAHVPILCPSQTPTGVPSSSPSASPTASLTTEVHSASPSSSLSSSPSSSPSLSPSSSPSMSPSSSPSDSPSTSPNSSPTEMPAASPSVSSPSSLLSSPSVSPSSSPSGSPSAAPSLETNPGTTPSTVDFTILDEAKEKENAMAKLRKEERNRRKAFIIGFSILGIMIIAGLSVFYRRQRASPPVTPA